MPSVAPAMVAHPRAQRRADRGVLAADGAGADHHHPGDGVERGDEAAGIQDVWVTLREARGMEGDRAGGDEHRVTAEDAVGAATFGTHHHGAVLAEPGCAAHHLNAVAGQVLAYARLHDGPHLVVAPARQLADVPGLEVHADPVDVGAAEAGQVQRGLAQCLGGHAGGADRGAAEVLGSLHQGDPLAEVGGVRGRLLSGGTGADHDEVDVLDRGRRRHGGIMPIRLPCASLRHGRARRPHPGHRG
jgi:hypothetical protein